MVSLARGAASPAGGGAGARLSDVCVVITAFEAAGTIARAVGSALAERAVSEVIVVDDGSADATLAAAERVDDGSGRLRLIRLDRNRGPSAARNAAIAASRAQFVAILDADDHFVPGRFAELDGAGEWDLIADNIAFVAEGTDPPIVPAALLAARRELSLGEFLARNIARRGRPRSELGFLKPVMRRASLNRLELRYDESLRLGEDFILYATALARGARFGLSARCGYVATVRPDSLSGRHRTADLAALARADSAMAAELVRWGASPGDRRLLARHLAALRQKAATRAFVDRKHEVGLVRATAGLLADPATLARATLEIVDGKLRRLIPRPVPATRLLFRPEEFGPAAAR